MHLREGMESFFWVVGWLGIQGKYWMEDQQEPGHEKAGQARLESRSSLLGEQRLASQVRALQTASESPKRRDSRPRVKLRRVCWQIPSLFPGCCGWKTKGPRRPHTDSRGSLGSLRPLTSFHPYIHCLKLQQCLERNWMGTAWEHWLLASPFPAGREREKSSHCIRTGSLALYNFPCFRVSDL